MDPHTINVPAQLLLDQTLAASTKLLWIIRQLGAPEGISPALLQTRSGLSRPTVLKGLVQLQSLAPLAANTSPPRFASLPIELLLDRSLGAQAKLLYGSLQLTPRFRYPSGQTTYAELSELTGLSHRWIRTTTRTLQEQGWLSASQQDKLKPIEFQLQNPVTERQAVEVTETKLRLSEADHRGEEIMREYLSLIVDTPEFEDNASPGFLINPYTDHLMQFDRYYPPQVAFEYNGEQHYRPTERYPKVTKFKRQLARDYMKHGICTLRGITLVVIHAEDLSLQTMLQKVGDLLPTRKLNGHEPLIAYLEEVSRPLRLKAKKESHRY